MPRKTNQYVNNKEFHQTLIDYDKICKDIEKMEKLNLIEEKVFELLLKRKNRLKNKIGKIFLKICEGLLTKPNFINYSWDRKSEMTSDACFYMSKNIRKFDISRNNPFAYFTQACFNAYRQHINKYKKIQSHFQSLGYIEQIFIKDNQGAPEEWE